MTLEIFFLFSHCKVKVSIGNSKSIWGYGSRFDGEEGSSLFSWGGGGGGVVRCRRIIKEKFLDFRSPEVGISVYSTLKLTIINTLWFSCQKLAFK